MRAGDTFYISNRKVDSHLWIVISDPGIDASRVVLVSVTTYEDYKESVCLLDVGDHPRVSHKSCIAYNEARLTTLESLKSLQAVGSLNSQPPVSSDLLSRIRAGVSLSTRIRSELIDILLDQGVIE